MTNLPRFSGRVAFPIALLAVGLCAAGTTLRMWSFNNESTGQPARHITPLMGTWVVVESDRGKALAQTAKNGDKVFNLALVEETNARDLELSVRFKAVAGEHDQGGGLVWRARDAKNYYLARYNPLEANYRVYKVVDGIRTQLQSADIAHADGWHSLRVTMAGDQIACSYDGREALNVKDATFPEAGKIGLWSKADAQSEFDDLTLAER